MKTVAAFSVILVFFITAEVEARRIPVRDLYRVPFKYIGGNINKTPAENFERILARQVFLNDLARFLKIPGVPSSMEAKQELERYLTRRLEILGVISSMEASEAWQELERYITRRRLPEIPNREMGKDSYSNHRFDMMDRSRLP